MYEARSINVKTLLEVFSATFSELFRCRFKSSILGALTFSASHRVWFRHGLTSFYTHTHTRYNLRLILRFQFHFVYTFYSANLFAEVNVRTFTLLFAVHLIHSFSSERADRTIRLVVRNRVFFGEQMKSSDHQLVRR